MEKLFILLLIIVSWNCHPDTRHHNNIHAIGLDTKDASQDSLIPQRYKSMFKLGHQAKFSLTYDDIDDIAGMGFRKIDSADLVALLNGDPLLNYNNSGFESYYYSYQEETKHYRAITIIADTEFHWRIYYLIYSLDGSLISKFEAAKIGGDGPYENLAWGLFLNDTTYLKNAASKKLDDNNNWITTDSVQTTIAFSDRGRLK